MASWLARGGFPPGTFRTGPYCECGCHDGVLVVTGAGFCCPCPDASGFVPLLVVKQADD